MQILTPLDFEQDLFLVINRSGYIRFMTAPPRSYLGVRQPEQVIGHHISEFIHPDDVPSFDKWLEPTTLPKQPGPVSHIMFRVRRPDGTWRWLEATSPSLEGHHVQDHILVFLRDIAAHRNVENQYRMAEPIAGFGIWSIHRNSAYAQMSAGMVRLFGYEPGDPATEKKFWPLNLVDRKDVHEVLTTLRQAFERPQKFSFTCAVRRKDGSRRFLKTRGSVEVDAWGNDQMFAISHDITTIHLAEERLRASEERYRLLTQRASDIICQLTPAGKIEFISPSVLRLTGRQPNRLKGQRFSSLLPLEEHARFDRFLGQLRQGEDNVLCTVQINGTAPGESWLELSGRSLKDAAGQVYGLVCAGRDISERKKFELELQAARRKAEQASAFKSNFLSHISHELRTPLNAILGFSEMIRDHAFDVSDNARYAEYGALIHESGSLLSLLIDDLLDLSKIEAGKYELHPEHVELNDIVPVCIQQIKHLTEQKKITVRDDISGMKFSLHADRRALIQILINLLSNAAKFTPEGGRIDLFGLRENGRIWLNVRDTGIGIKGADISRITEPFEQAAGTPGPAHEGTGLGLALVKSLVELHGGELKIESERGVGTTVSVALPADAAGKAAA